MALPNFFIAGAPKAGTDLLFYQLEQHPQIFMSALKEPNYFAEEVRTERFHPALRQYVAAGDAPMRAYLDAPVKPKRFGGMVTSLADYESLFVGAEGRRAIGEGSVCYLWSKTAAAGIAELLPDARIILTLMDPATRAFHQYLKSLADDNVSHDFSRHLELAFEDRMTLPQDEVRLFNPFLGLGEYADQVQRFLDAFPREQIFLSLYEDTLADYGGWFRRVLEFLGVDEGFVPEAVDVPSKPHFTMERPEPVFGAEERRRLVEYYREDVVRLQGLIGRDLGAWLR